MSSLASGSKRKSKANNYHTKQKEIHSQVHTVNNDEVLQDYHSREYRIIEKMVFQLSLAGQMNIHSYRF